MSLYKYVIPERVDVLEKGYIRFTQPTAFNDPLEMRPFCQGLAEDAILEEMLYFCSGHGTREIIWGLAFRELMWELEEIDPESHRLLNRRIKKDDSETMKAKFAVLTNVMPMIVNIAISNFIKSIGVLSLAEKADNLLMWAHYAQNHTGFVLEFDDTHEFFHSRKQWFRDYGELHKVKYSDERPQYLLFDNISLVEMLFTKSKEWEYEQEWRMLRNTHECDRIVLVEGADSIRLFSMPPRCIKGVIFGCRMLQGAKEKISNLIAENEKYSHVRKYQALLDEKRFKLNIVNSGI